MNITCIMGSPRIDGNSSTLAKHFCKTAKTLGANIKQYNLIKMNYKGCQACEACRTKSDMCIIQDDLKEVLESIYTSDLLIMASPVYFGDVSGLLKNFIDRTRSFLVPDFKTNPVKTRLKGDKKLVFILTQGNPDTESFKDIFPRYSMFFKWFGFKEAHLVRACGLYAAGEINDKKVTLQEVEDLAKKICS